MIRSSSEKLLIDSFAHFLVDGLCMVILFRQDKDMLSTLILLYNTLAFSTQCLTGIIIDRWGKGRYGIIISCLILSLSYFIDFNPYLTVTATGLANSLFHVSGGYMTLIDAEKKMAPLGIFVSPGCLGLVLGYSYPRLGLYFALGLLLIAVLSLFMDEENDHEIYHNIENANPMIMILLLAIMTRAIGGSVTQFSWKTSDILSIVMTMSVFMGKFLGGYIHEKFGIGKTSIVSIILSSILVSFCSSSMCLSLLGQLLLNLSMPVTLWLIYMLMNDKPGFAFGLAASVLWPGTLIGTLMNSSSYSSLLIIIAFMLGLFAIMFVERRIKQ